MNDLWNNYLDLQMDSAEIVGLLGAPKKIISFDELNSHVFNSGAYSIQYDFHLNKGGFYPSMHPDAVNYDSASRAYWYTQGFSPSGPGALVFLFDGAALVNILALEQE